MVGIMEFLLSALLLCSSALRRMSGSARSVGQRANWRTSYRALNDSGHRRALLRAWPVMRELWWFGSTGGAAGGGGG